MRGDGPTTKLIGECVFLRPLRRSDVEAFARWYGDARVTQCLGMPPLTRAKAEDLFRQVLHEANSVYLAIVTQEDEQVIGYVFLTDIMQRHRVAREFGIVIGDPAQWNHGYGTDATRLIIEYGFHQLHLHRIQLKVLDTNARALHVYRNVGFSEEGVQREARYVNGAYHDVVMMGLLEVEWHNMSGDNVMF